MQLDRQQVLRFRLQRHNLAQRRPADELLEAAGVAGLQNTPPGAAELALHARLEGLQAGQVQHRLEQTKDLLQAWSLRASPYIFPTGDAALFTTGLLPESEADTLAFIYGAKALLDRTGIGISAMDLVDWTATALDEALAGRAMTKDELGVELGERITGRLTAEQWAAWQLPSIVAAGQTMGVSLVRFALPIVALRGVCCHAERQGNQAFFRRTDEWLGRTPEAGAPEAARRDLVRRYLHAYGPSTPAQYAGWTGISAAQAQAAWRLIEAECGRVEMEGHAGWMLQEDISGLGALPQPRGARLLPAHDPYLQQQDRATLIPDRRRHKHIWRAVGSPGLALVDGVAVGIWRAQKQGKRLNVTVETFGSLPAAQQEAVAAEADAIAKLRGCERATAAFVNFPTN